MEVVPS